MLGGLKIRTMLPSRILIDDPQLATVGNSLGLDFCQLPCGSRQPDQKGKSTIQKEFTEDEVLVKLFAVKIKSFPGPRNDSRRASLREAN